MRSLKIATGSFLASTVLLFAAPLAAAADSECDPATAAAMQAQSDYRAALADYQQTVDNGGHPGQAERDNVDQLKHKADAAASHAQRVCGDQPTDPSGQKPSGPMNTGAGSTSQTTDATTSYTVLGGGAAALGATALWMRRRAARADN
ncbi:hypothetical protein [Streptomyces boninensis]|uniref:hypothetical protein n=1 Tax=Streptomyces boninensis TaxID=2039455 RepID=UPI003B21DDD2